MTRRATDRSAPNLPTGHGDAPAAAQPRSCEALGAAAVTGRARCRDAGDAGRSRRRLANRRVMRCAVRAAVESSAEPLRPRSAVASPRPRRTRAIREPAAARLTRPGAANAASVNCPQPPATPRYVRVRLRQKAERTSAPSRRHRGSSAQGTSKQAAITIIVGKRRRGVRGERTHRRARAHLRARSVAQLSRIVDERRHASVGNCHRPEPRATTGRNPRPPATGRSNRGFFARAGGLAIAPTRGDAPSRRRTAPARCRRQNRQ